MGTQYQHDGVLTPFERTEQSIKCLRNLTPHIDGMAVKEKTFFHDMNAMLQRGVQDATQKQLNWLKDLCDRYDR